ncbi:MAG: membrane protein insertion efficiency factor YidD [Ruminococcaceae bacterium]|nr:membrane protein insertion efficiency factor YidD [Oscillospiraceae bacterium]
MKYVCAWLIRLYQKFLSPLKRNPCCRFTPTCSAYALEAFMKRGFFVGFGLTVWRILRCNPFCAGGYDPVPPKKIPKYRRDTKDGEEDSLSALKETEDNDETPNKE